MIASFLPPVLLSSDHGVHGFECRSQEQEMWLRGYAQQPATTGATKVLVVTPTDGTNDFVPYYASCMAAIAVESAPPRLRRGRLLARLGVSIHHERRGLGAALLRDVIARTAAVGRQIGCRGLLVHAETPQARDFYRHLIPEFEPSPSDELHLVLLLKDILRSLASRQS